MDVSGLDTTLRGIESLGLRPGLEMEVFRYLLKGRRTISELVELIYGAGPSSSEFHSYYVKTWRAIRELEARGLISAPLLGKDKVYHITSHGLGVLLQISEDKDKSRPGILSWTDYVVFASTIILGIAAYSLDRPDILSTVFVFSLGLSTSRLLSRLRGVW